MSILKKALEEKQAKIKEKLNRRGIPIQDGVETKDGKEYSINSRGEIYRVSPQRPWRGKSQRRQVLKLRRAARLERDKDALLPTGIL